MDAAGTLAEVLKGEGPRVLATLARTIGDLAVAEDALSEATITALDAWPRTGIPDNPRAWLAVVARRKALDLLRRESARAAKEAAAFRWGTGAAPDQIEEAIEAMEPETSLRDDMLRLIFTCCHPALSREAQVALSLRTLARLEVPAIARAFLVPEATMAKRLVRARSKITTARIPYAIPSDAELPGRLAAVLAVVYLIATEAHAHGTRVGFEPPADSMMPTIVPAAELVRTVANPAGGLLVDIWHIFRSGTGYDQLVEVLPPEYVFAVELSDGRAEPVGTLYDDTFDNRLPPGEGEFDVASFVRALDSLGFEGPWGLEVMSTELRSLPVEVAAKRVFDAAVRVFEIARAGGGPSGR